MSEYDHSPSHGHGNPDVRFEESDVSTRPVVLSVVGLAVFTVVFTIAAHFTFQGLAAREKAAAPAVSPLAEQYAAKEPPEPRLQLQPKTDLDVMRAAEDKVLSTLAWVNKDAGTVQVPIERAMEILVTKNLPAREGPVPHRMAAHGVAPRQMAEAEGAPDWTGGWKVSREMDESHGHGGHGDAHGSAGGDAHAPAGAAKAGHDSHDSKGHGSEAHGH
jgi:hypothetical protein